MYYEEAWINGALHFRGTPTGEYRLVTDKGAIARAALLRLSEEQRVGVMAGFCKGCGTTDLPCYCQHDD